MPENVPDQISSKRYATKIDDNQLPLDNDRRIIVDSTGCCSLSYETKRSEELLDYFIDMMKWLEPNEVIIGASAWTNPSSLIATRIEYASTGVVAWLAGGANDVRHTVNIEISTSLGKVKLIQFVLRTYGSAVGLVLITGDDADVVVGSDIPPPRDPEPLLNLYPAAINFPLTAAVTGHTQRDIVLKNDGTGTAYIERILMAGPFSQTNSGDTVLEPGEFMQIHLTYSPTTTGEDAGYIEIQAADLDPLQAELTGTAEDAHRITIQGNQFIRTGGTPFRIKAVNWFGAESEVFVPHGLWARNYKAIINQIKAMGFNAVRLPFSGDLCDPQRMTGSGVINSQLNADLMDLSAIQVFDKIIAYMNEVGLYVILDHHRRNAGDGADGSPIDVTYSLDDWKASWRFMAERYGHINYVLGADLHNEPYQLEWDGWAALAEQAGNAILSIAPHWLIFVEGVGSYKGKSYWWGGELSGVADRPVKLSIPDRLAYSVHEYGLSVGNQSWLAKDNSVPANWPMNLYGVWRQHWGFIFEQNIAPIWIGEVGGKFGIDGNGQVTMSLNTQYERQWIYHLQRYMDGYFSGNNERQLNSSEQGISFAYWSFNPNSGDTGGLVQDDWTTEQSIKLELIRMMLNNSDVPYLYGLTPLPWNGIDEDAQVVVTQDGDDYAVTIKDLNDKLNNTNLAVGHVHFFAQNVDPNNAFTRQIWVRVPGAEKTIRIAKANGSDIGQTGGSDDITIQKGNLPNVQIDVSGTISTKDLGTITTSSNGSHTHNVNNSQGTTGNIEGPHYNAAGVVKFTDSVSSSGQHNHTVEIGEHNHTLSNAKTAALGSGTQISVKNEYIVLAAWYRSA